MGTVDQCTSQVYWFTSLGCLPAQKEAVETGSCVLDIPGPDLRIDLTAWASQTFLTAESQPGLAKRSFQLNLCRPAASSLCGDNSLVCEVDDTWENMKNNVIPTDPVPVKLASYDELREVITLRYIAAGTAKVFIDIECDAAATEPQVRLVHNNGSEFTFSMKTAKACFVPVRNVVILLLNNCTIVLLHPGCPLSRRESNRRHLQLREPPGQRVGLCHKDRGQPNVQVSDQGMRCPAHRQERVRPARPLPLSWPDGDLLLRGDGQW